jgi:hypothetical protein
MVPDKVNELLEQVCDRESFLRFVLELSNDSEQAEKLEKEDPEKYRYSGANGWENGSISRYLESAVAWANDSKKLDEEPSWKSFAVFLYCGKIYE